MSGLLFIYLKLICRCVSMFPGSHENPELIWNDDAREKVSDTVRKLSKGLDDRFLVFVTFR